MARDRAISDVVSFVLTFSVIITSVGLVTVVGFAQLEAFEEDEQLQSAEVTFELFAQSFDEIEESDAEKRTEAIDLSGGSLLVDQPSSSATVTVSTGSGPVSESFELNALAYRLGDTEIAYENGATLRGAQDWESGIINHEPGFVCTEETAVLSFVTVGMDRSIQRAGSGTLRVTATRENTSLLYPVETAGRNASGATGVTFEIDSPRATQWEQYFDRADGWAITASSGSTVEVTCDPGSGPSTVYVRRTVMNISFAG